MKTKKEEKDATEKNNMLAALRVWINQRPGLEYANYGEARSYRAEIAQWCPVGTALTILALFPARQGSAGIGKVEDMSKDEGEEKEQWK